MSRRVFPPAVSVGESSTGDGRQSVVLLVSVPISASPLPFLTPHEARPSVRPLKPARRGTVIPTVLLSYPAYCDTAHLIAAAGADEIAWLGSVRRLSRARFIVDRVFLVPQSVGVEECTINPRALGGFCHALLEADPANRTLVDRLRFWGHLHPPWIGTTASPEDERQMGLFAESPWFIRGIFSRSGTATFTFFDYARGLMVEDCPWGVAVEDGGRRQAITEAVRRNVVRSDRRRRKTRRLPS